MRKSTHLQVVAEAYYTIRNYYEIKSSTLRGRVDRR